MNSPRDTFFNTINLIAKFCPNIYVITVDFGCDELDKFKREFPDRFINAGVSEQNAILMATGLALSGKTPIVFGILSFLARRPFEQIVTNVHGMNLGVALVGVGVDRDYNDAGYTHWYEDNILEKYMNTIKCENEQKLIMDIKHFIKHPSPTLFMLRRSW